MKPLANSTFAYLAERLDRLADGHRLRRLVPRQSIGAFLIDGSGKRLVNFGGNDYLGLAADRTTASQPTGSMASALVCGWTPLHQRLAKQVTELEGTEASVLFPSGYAACSGTAATLAEKGDLILSDQLNHASLIDGCRLSAAECIVFPHRDVKFVAETLHQRAGEFERIWILTDGVFSMDGHVAPLKELCDVADTYSAIMVVDEAHGTGVLGKTGSGICEAAGVKDRVAIRIGTLSKAIGCQGGFVAGPKVVVDYLINRCRSLIFSTSLAPASVASSIAAIDSFRSEPERRHRVGRYAQLIRDRLSIDAVDENEASVPIIPVVMGDDERAVDAAERLAGAGFYVPAIRPPTVPIGSSRLRISVSAIHDQSMIDELLRQLSKLT
ncbi:8-amino-7-oxononanoate synthase 2 [Novipirellula aureliae]|uniref:8-amino-7-oxononanoate synthase n=1 Tax=Novipirellula aureliae TaxID=2527966 RepID=A0A5C6DDI7_9BACT|nr:8-amino-7-oxononanoate synthase [Novipirellula aureliae]TWU35303.1 8-amino-7-oxononanoate synthase 2 [Novipirellula aureliae]